MFAMGLTLIELNEINFDIVDRYIKKGINLPVFQKLIDDGISRTSSEQIYQNIEPWIQWPTVHTGLTFSEHNIFRLGDMVRCPHQQIFEEVENQGKTVLAVSPMNAVNRIKGEFIPDPWTQTEPDNSISSKWLHQALVQSVNDNAQSKISKTTYLKLIGALAILLPIGKLYKLSKGLKFALSKKWRKAVFLDQLLVEVFVTKMKRSRPDFGTIFLNAGAHIQHHYFHASGAINTTFKNPEWYLDSSFDPLLEVLKVYDNLIGEIIGVSDDYIICTGLTQDPFDKPKYYYRLKDHKKFLEQRKLKFSDIQPRMTRDFLIEFNTKKDLLECHKYLKKMKIDGEHLFGKIENRDKQLFVTLDYEKEISADVVLDEPFAQKGRLVDDVTFVALKNGHHNAKGFLFCSQGIKQHLPSEGTFELSKVHTALQHFFKINSTKSAI